MNDGIKFEVKGDDLFINDRKVIQAWESRTGWFWFATEKVEDRIPGQGGGGSMIDGQEVRDTIYSGRRDDPALESKDRGRQYLEKLADKSRN